MGPPPCERGAGGFEPKQVTSRLTCTSFSLRLYSWHIYDFFLMKKLLSFSVLSFLLLFSGCSSQVIDKSTTSSGASMSSGSTMHDMTSMMQVSSDEEFIAKMIPHHEEAVLSSQNLLETSKNEKLRTIAKGIIAAQKKEIMQMKEWSIAWFGKDVTNRNQYMQMMPKLVGLSPEALDIAYMTGMVAHHQGAIDMARDLQKFTQRTELQTLAKNIIDSQQQEINEFTAMLGK